MYKGISLLVIAAALAAGCKKSNTQTISEDTAAPVITLNGRTNDTISLSSVYADPGASAADNQDGDISTNINVTGTVNRNLVGEYRLYYNVKDAAGNNAVQATRYVYVKNDAAYLVGYYNAAGTCTLPATSTTGNYYTDVKISTTINNRIIFEDHTNSANPNMYADVNSGSITVPQQGGGGYSYNGTGVLSASKTSFTINTNTNYGTNYQYTCSYVYTKQ